MKLYSGIDLHSTNSYMAIVDENGNKYLSWAFSEAAELARRFDDRARAYYNRKLRKTNFMVAHAALAHKLARAAYHIMRDQVEFMPDKIFT